MPYRGSFDPETAPADRLAPPRDAYPWFVAGGAALAAVAGYVNLVMLGFFHVPVSHMTGAVSRLGADLAAGDTADLQAVVGIVLGFVLGAAVSGAVIGSRRLAAGRRYGVALLIEAGLLAAAWLLGARGARAAVPLAATACGVQNAMASSYYGLVVRTTHVTGLVTDIGLLLGQGLRERRLPLWRVAMLGTLLLGFLVGAMAGAAASQVWGVDALGAAALATGTAGLVYWIRRHRLRTPPPERTDDGA